MALVPKELSLYHVFSYVSSDHTPVSQVLDKVISHQSLGVALSSALWENSDEKEKRGQGDVSLISKSC